MKMSREVGRKRVLSAMTAILILGTFFAISDAFAEPQRGWLGVSIREMTPSMRGEYELGDRYGLLITDVFPDSPADDAGLREDDVILKYDGQQVDRADAFSDMVRKTDPETKVHVTIMRGGKEKELEVEIGRRRSRWGPGFFGWPGDDHHNVFFMNRAQLGVRVQELNADLASYFGVEAGSGALVVEVTDDSPAMQAGLKSGDVIIKADDEKITDPEDLFAVLEDHEEGDKIKIEYIRHNKQGTAEVELEEGSGYRFRFGEGIAPLPPIPKPPKIKIRELHGEGDVI